MANINEEYQILDPEYQDMLDEDDWSDDEDEYDNDDVILIELFSDEYEGFYEMSETEDEDIPQ